MISIYHLSTRCARHGCSSEALQLAENRPFWWEKFRLKVSRYDEWCILFTSSSVVGGRLTLNFADMHNYAGRQQDHVQLQFRPHGTGLAQRCRWAATGIQGQRHADQQSCVPQGNRSVLSVVTSNYCESTPCLKKTVKIVFVRTSSNFHQLW